MKLAHTPGPWIVLGRENSVGDIGVGPEAESAYPVAVVQVQPGTGYAAANAALIAAAPELLDIARWALAAFTYPPVLSAVPADVREEYKRRALVTGAAIARAEGRP